MHPTSKVRLLTKWLTARESRGVAVTLSLETAAGLREPPTARLPAYLIRI
jgi:hypothetical protein